MTANNRGTPKNLEELVRHILTTPGTGNIAARSQSIIRDYLAQKFGAAVLGHPECETVLMELFKQCIQPIWDESIDDSSSEVDWSKARPNPYVTKKEYRKAMPYGGVCHNPDCSTISVAGSTKSTCHCGWEWNSTKPPEKK
jgi:hypothetical protein